MTDKQLEEIRRHLEETYVDGNQNPGDFYNQLIDLWESVFKLACYILVCFEGPVKIQKILNSMGKKNGI